MARKGSNLLSKPLFGVMALVLFVFLLIYIYVKMSEISNPCWSEVLKGLEPLKTGTSTAPILNFNEKCLDTFVITADSGMCRLECRKADDDDQERACAAKCTAGTAEMPKSFIVAIPTNKNLFGRIGSVIYSRDFYEIMLGKLEVFTVDCQVTSVDPAIKQCAAGTIAAGATTWVCPGNSTASYTLEIDDTKKVCDIKVKT